MFCTQCGYELADDHRFCPQCAMPTATVAPRPAGPPKRLVRPMREKVVGGVCAGFADYLNIELTLMRIIWLTVAVFTGVGFIAYVICWIVMPRDYELLPEPTARASEPESTRAPMAQNEAETGSSSA